MSKCQHNECERDAVAEWNGCVFCDEHVRERLRTTADRKLEAENKSLREELRIIREWYGAESIDTLLAQHSIPRTSAAT
jgi:hypothetical protein